VVHARRLHQLKVPDREGGEDPESADVRTEGNSDWATPGKYQNPEFRIDPRSGDFYKAIIEQRSSIKARLKSCSPSEREALESQQQALKILANATSYGIFVEINVEELTKPASALRYSDDGAPSEISVDKAELPGTYFIRFLLR